MNPTLTLNQANILRYRNYRKLKNNLFLGMIALLTFSAVVPLFSVIGHLILSGYSSLNFDFFTKLPKAMGETGGGIGNAILGTFELTLIASLISIPFGIFLGVYLSENKTTRLARTVRFSTDILSSIPSIIVGLFIYAWIVRPMKGFSVIAGSAALSLIMFPIIAKTADEVLQLVPETLREAGLALGIPRWRVMLSVIIPSARSGLITGSLLAIARAAGETAPLLLTAFGNRYWNTKLNEPISSLPVQIYNFAMSPYPDWQKQAWAGALTLVFFVFLINLSARLLWIKKS